MNAPQPRKGARPGEAFKGAIADLALAAKLVLAGVIIYIIIISIGIL